VDTASGVFWAAFGGGAAAGIFTLIAIVVAEWTRWFIDRPLIKVSVGFAYVHNHPLFDENTRYICLEAKNPHSKPVTLSTFGWRYKSKEPMKFQVMPDGTLQFPFELESGKAISQLSPEEDFFEALRKEGLRPRDLKCVFFELSSGKIFRGKITRVTMQALENHFSTTSTTHESK
jgi:hypothetical protein